MKQQKTLTICACLILFSFALSIPAYSWQSSTEQSMGKIKGLVLNQDNARVAEATIIIEGGPKTGFKKSILSGQAGDFEIEVPAGVYDITVRAVGFRRFEGWQLKVNPKVTEMINIHLEVGEYRQ